MLVSTLLTVVIDVPFAVVVDAGMEFERPLALAFAAFVAAPAFMMRLLTAACATDLKSASVGGLDKTDDAGAATGAEDRGA